MSFVSEVRTVGFIGLFEEAVLMGELVVGLAHSNRANRTELGFSGAKPG